MLIDVTFTPQDLRRLPLAGSTVVVIDIIRAATTITTALANGCTAVIPTLSVAAARRVAGALAGERPLLGGERGGQRIDGFDFGNSPGDYTATAVGGRLLVFTTTNGTATINAGRAADEIVVGALVNLEAVVQHVARAGRPVVFAASGRARRPVLDDVVTAGLMAKRLAQVAGAAAGLTDAARMAVLVAERYETDPLQALRQSASGRALVRIGLDADLAFCAGRDRFSVVPVLRGDRLVVA